MEHIGELLPKGSTVAEHQAWIGEMMKKADLTNSLDRIDGYECHICKDIGVIYNPETNSGRPCGCMEIKRQREIIVASGISTEFREKSFDNFQGWNNFAKAMKRLSQEYTRQFAHGHKNSSIAFLGQSGAGKSHLTFAIANTMMGQGVPVYYMPYIDKISELKALARQNYDEHSSFTQKMGFYKRVKVLLIDDLFKKAETSSGRINDVDIRYMFDIINHRILNGLPMVISSELGVNDLLDVDEALGGRILEACGKYLIVINKDKNLNYRRRSIE